MSLRPGSTVGPYELVALIGAGGMGEVYCARDARLGRDVAIKVLPAEFAADPERLKRFEREARATAALSHPNILYVHDVGTHEGVPYLVEELLEGESLRERLARGALAVPDALRIAVQVAHGLAAAHEKHIVHRDLKPANVFVTKDGIVKILDFGIAKLIAPGSVDDRARPTTVVEATEAGTTLGTVGYMSPEQVRGLTIDHRSDIFSLGCVLYEMLSGCSPFRRDTVADTASAILHEDPAPLSGTVRSIPPAIEGIVTRCLEKSPEDRFQSARDLAHDLSATMPDTSPAKVASITKPMRRRRFMGWALAGLAVLAAVGVLVVKLRPAGPSARAAGPPKIVVLPFENLGAPEDAYFAAGMAEEITSRLANVQGLGVISRTSAVQYDRRGKTVKQIGSDLGVDYVLEGSVRWDRGVGRESRVRITPQLIRVADDTHVWADRYERVIADVFAIQSEVAGNAVKAMGVTLLPREQTALREVSTNDLQAYDLYLRGKEQTRAWARRDVEGAEQMFQAAVDRDPTFAQALARLAMMHTLTYWEYFDRSPERLVKAKEAAERAIELRPDLAEPHLALGSYFYRALLDYPRALEQYAAALKIQPSNSTAINDMGNILRRQGRWVEAAETFGRALELDPKNAVLLWNLGGALQYARRYPEADGAFELAIVLGQQWAELCANRAWLQLSWHGDVDKAEAVLNEAAGVTDDLGHIAEQRLRVLLARRDYQGALRQLQAEMRGAFDKQNVYLPIPLLRGQVHRVAGQQDLARRSFEAARLDLEQRIRQDPSDHRFHGSLGIAYAGLGRGEDAVREARLGCDLMPASKDAMRAQHRLEDLALVYTMVGKPSDAIATLDNLLARSGWWTPHVLRLEPRWDPLRSDPRFQALLKKYEVRP